MATLLSRVATLLNNPEDTPLSLTCTLPRQEATHLSQVATPQPLVATLDRQEATNLPHYQRAAGEADLLGVIHPVHPPLASLPVIPLWPTSTLQAPRTPKPLSRGGMVCPPLTNSRMACTHRQEGPCLKARGWATLASRASPCPASEEHRRPCRGTPRLRHQIPPCPGTEGHQHLCRGTPRVHPPIQRPVTEEGPCL